MAISNLTVREWTEGCWLVEYDIRLPFGESSTGREWFNSHEQAKARWAFLRRTYNA